MDNVDNAKNTTETVVDSGLQEMALSSLHDMHVSQVREHTSVHTPPTHAPII